MVKKDMKAALANSLRAEDAAVRSRFEKAETLFSERTPSQIQEQGKAESQSPTIEDEKPKVIRDSFTLPSSDYDLIATLKQRCLESAINVTKSEIIRAGLHALNTMPDSDLAQVVEGLEKVKTGRPTNKT
ncbi:MAG: hypothetical protein LH679_20980 [Cyanobacteria bacterium CAN_BIN43]|jgi:hypothetical protein|nr:hypothetical protein [Cyanobacteria bacterium CAN_BIN43]